MLSTTGGLWSWARRAAGPPRRRATAARIGEGRCISPGWVRRQRRRMAASGLGDGQRPEDQPLAVGSDIHLDFVAAPELAHEDLLTEWILDVALDRPLQRAGPEALVVPVLDQEIDRSRGQPDLIAQPALHLPQENRHDLRDVLLI